MHRGTVIRRRGVLIRLHAVGLFGGLRLLLARCILSCALHFLGFAHRISDSLGVAVYYSDEGY